MTLFRNRYRIESTRLKGWDYSRPGWYFLTTVTKHRACLFGDVVNGEMVLNPLGQIVQACWDDLPNHYPTMIPDAFVIMPDHVHMVIGLMDIDESPVSEIIRALKSFSSRRINALRGTPGTPIWQTRYHDRIVRDHSELNRIRRYIALNPAKWPADRNAHSHDDLLPEAGIPHAS